IKALYSSLASVVNAGAIQKPLIINSLGHYFSAQRFWGLLGCEHAVNAGAGVIALPLPAARFGDKLLIRRQPHVPRTVIPPENLPRLPGKISRQTSVPRARLLRFSSVLQSIDRSMTKCQKSTGTEGSMRTKIVDEDRLGARCDPVGFRIENA